MPASITPGYEVLHTVRVATKTSHVDRKHPSSTTLQDNGTVRDERLGDRGVAMTGGSVEGRVPTLVLNLNTSTCMGREKVI